MSNDLLFSILPREGKEPIEHDDLRVKQVEKEAKLRALNDEEKELFSEEREAREKFQKKSDEKSKKEKPDDDTKNSAEKKDPELPTVDEHGRKHLDIYI